MQCYANSVNQSTRVVYTCNVSNVGNLRGDVQPNGSINLLYLYSCSYRLLIKAVANSFTLHLIYLNCFIFRD